MAAASESSLSKCQTVAVRGEASNSGEGCPGTELTPGVFGHTKAVMSVSMAHLSRFAIRKLGSRQSRTPRLQEPDSCLLCTLSRLQKKTGSLTSGGTEKSREKSRDATKSEGRLF